MAKTDKKARLAKEVTEVLPALTLIVDDDLGIQEMNDAARRFLGSDPEQALQMRQGEAFGCAHGKDAPAGCGRGRFCQICPIREAAVTAWNEQRVVRRRTKAHLETFEGTRDLHMLVTATPLPAQGAPRILLALEDIDALVQLQQSVPICASCKRIREDDHYWTQMDGYFRQHLDLELSDGICPECSQEFFGKLLKTQPLPFKARATPAKGC